MTLRHLEIFICVCEKSNMTKAANELHISQPSVSQAIHELEEYYGSRLFERFGHRLMITKAGKRLSAYAYELIRLNAQTESAMKNLRESCVLRIGASVTVGASILIDLLTYMRKTEPKQEIFSEIHNTAELEAMLLNDTLDLALVEGKIQSEYISVLPFAVDKLICIASPNNILAEKKIVSPAAIQHIRFFVREKGSGTRSLFHEIMTKNNIPYEIAGVYNNAESLKKAVEADLGISVISRLAVREELHDKKLATFTVQGLSFNRTFRIAYHKNKYISPQLQKIMDACIQLGKNCAAAESI